MKTLFSTAIGSQEKHIATGHHVHGYGRHILPLCLLFSVYILSIGCTKEAMDNRSNDQGIAGSTDMSSANVVNAYNGLSEKTSWELQQARAATARYRDVKNAIKDGYHDIAVDVENMGHHYMKPDLVDGKFDMKNPEILVYNRNHDGEQELVAVEYAVPLSMPMPEGFTGSGDVWDGNAGFQLWLLHAWVWAFNPNGVFNPTNPNVHLH